MASKRQAASPMTAGSIPAVMGHALPALRHIADIRQFPRVIVLLLKASPNTAIVLFWKGSGPPMPRSIFFHHFLFLPLIRGNHHFHNGEQGTLVPHGCRDSSRVFRKARTAVAGMEELRPDTAVPAYCLCRTLAPVFSHIPGQYH